MELSTQLTENVVQSSFTGLIRTVLMIIGLMVVLRFVGQLMIAKRNLAEHNRLDQERRKAEQELARKRKNFGKTEVLQSKASGEDVDFEVLD
jgi:hypothetical protein